MTFSQKFFRKTAVFAAYSAFALSSAVSYANGPFTVISSTQTTVGELTRTQTFVQNGTSSINTFGVEHIVKTNQGPGVLSGALILLPALGSTSLEYTSGDSKTGKDFENSIAANIARKNIDVYVYSPRETTLAPGSCSPGSGVDCSPLAGWGIQARLNDIAYIQQLVSNVWGSTLPYIGGHSLGAMTTIAAVNQNPTSYAGIVLIDGTLYFTDPTLEANYEIICNGVTAEIGAGIVSSESLNLTALLLLRRSQENPMGPVPLLSYPAGTTNRQAYVGFLATPQAGPPASIFPPGAVLAVGSVAQNSFTYSSENRLSSQLRAFTEYFTNAEIQDFTCSAGGSRTFTGNLSQFKGRVLAFEMGQAFGPYMAPVIGLMGSTDVTVKNFANYGHVDLVSSQDHLMLLDDPIAFWIQQN